MSGRAYTKFVYAIQAQTSRHVKFGIAGNVEQRLAELQCGNPERLVILATKPGDLSIERHIHKLLDEHRLEGEWFAWGARTSAVVDAMNGRGDRMPLFELPALGLDPFEHWRIQPFEHTLAWLG